MNTTNSTNLPVYMVLSNTGLKLYEGTNIEEAYETAINANAENQNSKEVFSVVRRTPYRLIIDRALAHVYGDFPWFLADIDKAVWYMSEQEYNEQLTQANALWIIKGKNSNYAANFDDVYYESYYDNYKF